MKLISSLELPDSKIKKYRANSQHPLFENLRSIILKYVGVDQLLEEVFYKLGQVEKVYFTGEIAEGKNTPFIDLVVVGDIDKVYFNELLQRAETIMHKKIRVALYLSSDFNETILQGLQHICVFEQEELK